MLDKLRSWQSTHFRNITKLRGVEVYLIFFFFKLFQDKKHPPKPHLAEEWVLLNNYFNLGVKYSKSLNSFYNLYESYGKEISYKG